MRPEAKNSPTPESVVSDHQARRSPGRAPRASRAWENRLARDSTSPKVIRSSPNVTARRCGAAPAAQARTSLTMSGMGIPGAARSSAHACGHPLEHGPGVDPDVHAGDVARLVTGE